MSAAAVVVHGLWMPGTETAILRRRLAAAGLPARCFRYRTVSEGLDANAARLAELVDALPEDTVHLVGHSLGGVLIRHMLERFPPARPGRVVALGSPFTGCCAGRALAAYGLGRTLLGKCMLELLESGGCREWRGPRELGIIAGDVGLGFGRLVCRLPEPNDGTVAVAETRLPGATDHLVLHVTHTSMLWSPEVAQQTLCFLRTGRFAHEEEAAVKIAAGKPLPPGPSA
ncbi:MAG TPA: alpha/beta fold hydrolase [Gammaproteobacteria bacterium]